MKTVQKGEDIRRVRDEEADLFVKSRGYKFIPKSVWKETRNTSKQTGENEVKEKTPKSKKSKN